jgi:DNA-binding response OmpR family regulator
MTDASRIQSTEHRATWLVLATDGPATELEGLTGGTVYVRTVADASTFSSVLINDRPRIAIVTEPPAGPSEFSLLRQEQRRRHQALRTIHLSPASAITQRLGALRSGFDEALSTAVDPVELAERAMILEEQARARPGLRLPVADGFELDLVAHELRLDGTAIHLRPKEFQLLATLAAHPGRAYSRRQLLDRVWGPNQVGDPRTVDVHVRWIRSKIEPQPDRPVHLVTVRGVGYRLDPPLTEP